VRAKGRTSGEVQFWRARICHVTQAPPLNDQHPSRTPYQPKDHPSSSAPYPHAFRVSSYTEPILHRRRREFKAAPKSPCRVIEK
jgi:hypothetical protein